MDRDRLAMTTELDISLDVVAKLATPIFVDREVKSRIGHFSLFLSLCWARLLVCFHADFSLATGISRCRLSLRLDPLTPYEGENHVVPAQGLRKNRLVFLPFPIGMVAWTE